MFSVLSKPVDLNVLLDAPKRIARSAPSSKFEASTGGTFSDVPALGAPRPPITAQVSGATASACTMRGNIVHAKGERRAGSNRS